MKKIRDGKWIDQQIHPIRSHHSGRMAHATATGLKKDEFFHPHFCACWQ
jgi:hypothetical protein